MLPTGNLPKPTQRRSHISVKKIVREFCMMTTVTQRKYTIGSWYF